MKKIIAFFLTALILLSFVSCGEIETAAAKDFKYEDATITLTKAFKKQKTDDEGYILLAAKKQIYLTVTTVDQESFEEYGYSGPVEIGMQMFSYYAQYELFDNFIPITYVQGHYYFSYRDIASDTTYHTALVVAGEMYMLTFECKSEKYEALKPYFIEWAKSLTVEF